MRSVSLLIPVADTPAINQWCEDRGYGPEDFSVPIREPGAEFASHMGCHWPHAPVADMQAAFSGLIVSERETDEAGYGAPHFREIVEDRGLDWSAKDQWATTMKGDQKTADGTKWESLVDHNVFPPGENEEKWADKGPALL